MQAHLKEAMVTALARDAKIYGNTAQIHDHVQGTVDKYLQLDHEYLLKIRGVKTPNEP